MKGQQWVCPVEAAELSPIFALFSARLHADKDASNRPWPDILCTWKARIWVTALQPEVSQGLRAALRVYSSNDLGISSKIFVA